MFICNDCGTTFSDPKRVQDGFPHAFGVERYTENVCPQCESGNYEPGVPCGNPSCALPMRPTDHICTACRRVLHRNICKFFDGLTAAEEEQFNDWMDGDVIQSRKGWDVDDG